MSDIAPPGVPRDVEGGELTSSWRLERPVLRQAITAASILVALIHVWFNTVGTVSEIYAASLHFGMFGALCALYFPVNPGATGTFARRAGLVRAALLVFMVPPTWIRGSAHCASARNTGRCPSGHCGPESRCSLRDRWAAGNRPSALR